MRDPRRSIPMVTASHLQLEPDWPDLYVNVNPQRHERADPGGFYHECTAAHCDYQGSNPSWVPVLVPGRMKVRQMKWEQLVLKTEREELQAIANAVLTANFDQALILATKWSKK